MHNVFDTCFLVQSPKEAFTRLETIAADYYSHFLIDAVGGPCYDELLRHAPGSLGEDHRRRTGHLPEGILNPSLFDYLMRCFGDRRKTRIVHGHAGEPSGDVERDLVALMGVNHSDTELLEWWRKDRMWVSLATHGIPTNIYTRDKGFSRAGPTLARHGILVKGV